VYKQRWQCAKTLTSIEKNVETLPMCGNLGWLRNKV